MGEYRMDVECDRVDDPDNCGWEGDVVADSWVRTGDVYVFWKCPRCGVEHENNLGSVDHFYED